MKNKIKDIISDYSYIVLGPALTGFGISVFMNPAKLAPGGVSGLATLVYHLVLEKAGKAWDLGVIMLCFSIPIYLLGLTLFGKEYGLKTLMGTLLLSMFTTLFNLLLPSGVIDYTKETSLWLCTLFTGITNGVGMGLVMRAGSNTGGTDIIAQIIARYTHIALGTALFIVDGIIIFGSAFIFGIENALYSYVISLMISLIIDRVIVPLGTNYAKSVFIISPKINEIGTFILKDLNRSGTIISAKGLFTRGEKDMLMTVVPKKDIAKLTRCVKSYDPTAFIIVQDTYHVLGEGYSPIDVLAENKDVTQQ